MKKSTGKDENITTAGIITNLRVVKSKKGDFYAQGALEDMSGKVEMLVFPEAYRKLPEKVKLEVPVLIRGGVRIEEGANPKLTVNEISPLEDAQSSASDAPCAFAFRWRAQRRHSRRAHTLFNERKGRSQGVV